MAAVLVVLSTTPAQGQQNNSGKAGGDLGRELIESASRPSHDQSGGRSGAGTVTVGDSTFDIGEILPGASQSSMDQMRFDNQSIQALENQGITAYDERARSEGSQGEAARAMIDLSQSQSQRGAAASAVASLGWLQDAGAIKDQLGESFSDCKATVEFLDREPIRGKVISEESCTVSASGSAGDASCERRLNLNSVRNEPDAFPEDPMNRRCPNGWRPVGTDQCSIIQVSPSVASAGSCAVAESGSGCTRQWECTAEGPINIDGQNITGAMLDSWGTPLLFPGAPRMCQSARAVTSCPVCIEGNNGNEHSCSMVNISDNEGSTCSALERNGSCRQIGTTCVLRDEQTGQCALTSRRYSCEREATVEVHGVLQGNSCSENIQCVDGSCHGGMGFSDDPEMSMQEAMARMVVFDTMLSDRSYDAEAMSKGDGSSITPDQQRAMDQVRLFKGESMECQKGFAGLVDCCGKTNSNAQELYWSIYASINRDRQAARAAQDGQESGFKQWQSGGAGMASLSNPFTSLRDNVMGGASDRPIEAIATTAWDEFMARARSEIKPSLSPSWACKDEEFDLAIQREVDMCSYAGTYCSKRVLGACLKRRESYCCYKSPMSKQLRASAEPNGQPPQSCDGLRVEEIDRINWDAIDFTRLVVGMNEGGAFGKANDPGNASQNFTGSGQTGSMGGADRKSVDERSEERLASLDMPAARASIAADARTRDYRQAAPTQRTEPGLSFAAGYLAVPSGRSSAIAVRRTGSAGAASATVTVVAGSPETAGFYSETILWGDGDTSDRMIRLDPPAGARGEVVLELQGPVTGHREVVIQVN